MNLLRGSIVITSLCLIAIAMVALRGAQTRAAAHALHLELQQVEAKRTLWRVQAAIARLRAPNEIRHRVKLLKDKPKDAESDASVDYDLASRIWQR